MEENTTLPEIDVPIADVDGDELEQFAQKSMEEVRDTLELNRKEAKRLSEVDTELDEVLSNDNIRQMDIRARPLENPKVTLWLKDCPMWANTAWTDTIYPNGLNSYNGKVQVTFDVRPF